MLLSRQRCPPPKRSWRRITSTFPLPSSSVLPRRSAASGSAGFPDEAHRIRYHGGGEKSGNLPRCHFQVLFGGRCLYASAFLTCMPTQPTANRKVTMICSFTNCFDRVQPLFSECVPSSARLMVLWIFSAGKKLLEIQWRSPKDRCSMLFQPSGWLWRV